MAKTIRKLRPSDYWRIGEHESWFADMAAEGLYIKKMGKFFAKFVKGEPNKMKYRIEVTSGQGITPDQMDLYSDNGWEYVTSYNVFHVFSSPAILNAPELHTDPGEKLLLLKYLITS